MEPLSEEITWSELDDRFAAAEGWSVSIKQHPRRTRKRLRRMGQSEDRKVWRLVVQREERCAVKTLLRKNIRYDQDDLLAHKVGASLVARLNQMIA